MTNEQPIDSETFRDDSESETRIDYYVTQGVCSTDGAGRVPVFGIRAELFVGGRLSTVSQIDDVSPSREAVAAMAALFAKNRVTPVTLKDVVEDCISAQIQV